jgi:methylmalonyl-CoA mutase N-terminal domain/subunit
MGIKTNKLYDAYLVGEKPPNYKTLSGIELKQFYTAGDLRHMDEVPGEYPFTRGIHPDMYRRRFWTRRQQSGFGTPEQSNQRMKFLLSQGQTGLNCDPDVVTHLGLDPDYPLAEGDIGLAGTSISTLEDMEKLFQDIPLDKVSTTIIVHPPTSAVLMAMYLIIARKMGIPESMLIGTIMNDALNQLVGPTVEAVDRFFPVEAGVRLGLDVMEYCVQHMPRWNILNINAYNMRETGISAVQEAAFALSLAADYIQRLMERDLAVDEFARKIAFFCSMDIDFLEEIAKIRAMRRIWAKMLKERFGAKDQRSCWFRTAIQTSALPLTAQQPLNNIVRATIQTLAAVLAGTQSIHTTSYDEGYALPTEESHKLSIRLQQVIAYETNVTKTVDPLGGSYVIEGLTDRLEEEIQSLMQVIEDKSGFIECFKQGWVEEQINEARYEYARRIESGEQLVVGVNAFEEGGEETRIDLFKQASDMQEKRKQYIIAYKRNRNQEKVDKALDRLYQEATAAKRVNLFTPVLEAVEAGATTGEVVNTLRKAENFEIRL